MARTKNNPSKGKPSSNKGKAEKKPTKSAAKSVAKTSEKGTKKKAEKRKRAPEDEGSASSSEEKKERKPRRYHPGTVALRKIKKLQKESGKANIISRGPFKRQVRRFMGDGLRVESEAINTMREAVESFQHDVVVDAVGLTVEFRKKKTLIPKAITHAHSIVLDNSLDKGLFTYSRRAVPTPEEEKERSEKAKKRLEAQRAKRAAKPKKEKAKKAEEAESESSSSSSSAADDSPSVDKSEEGAPAESPQEEEGGDKAE